jgi:hypothetical protein
MIIVNKRCCQLTSARCVSLLSRACLLSLLSLVIKLLRLLNMYSKFSTPSTTFMSHDESSVIRCSIELYKCLENECSIKSVVKWSTQSNSSLSWNYKHKDVLKTLIWTWRTFKISQNRQTRFSIIWDVLKVVKMLMLV